MRRAKQAVRSDFFPCKLKIYIDFFYYPSCTIKLSATTMMHDVAFSNSLLRSRTCYLRTYDCSGYPQCSQVVYCFNPRFILPMFFYTMRDAFRRCSPRLWRVHALSSAIFILLPPDPPSSASRSAYT